MWFLGTMMDPLTLIVLCGVVLSISLAQQQAAFAGPPGWRMVDRFFGFRFEL